MINTMEINPDELPALDLFENCRLCLAKDKVSVDIFSDGHEIRHLYYKIVSCFPVNVTQDDKLPRKICTQCNEKVDDFYQFWTLTAKSQKTLLEWVEKRELLPTTKIKTEDDVPEFKQEAMDYNSDDDNEMDRYDDDNSEEESSMQPAAIVKVLDEGEEGAVVASTTPAGPSTTSIKLSKYERNLEAGAVQSGDRFDCALCDRWFRHSSQLDVHVALHQDAPFTCHLCNRVFKRKYRLREHVILHVEGIRAHLENKPFTCDFCEKRFKHKFSVERHVKHVHEGVERTRRQYKHQCTTCGKCFPSVPTLESHQYKHTGVKKYSCQLCAMQYASTDSLGKHMKWVHEGVKRPHREENRQCEICGKSFNHSSHYRRHLANIHGDGKPACKVCGKIVSSSFLKAHMNMHTGEKPYECTVCFERYRVRSSFTAHYKSKHPDHKPPDYRKSMPSGKNPENVSGARSEETYSCDMCNGNYASKEFLKEHILQAHQVQDTQRVDRSKQCELCGKSFNHASQYRRHLVESHGDGKPACTVCGKVVSSHFLKTHMNMHTGEKPYECTVCVMHFATRSSFTGHYKSKHPGQTPPDYRKPGSSNRPTLVGHF